MLAWGSLLAGLVKLFNNITAWFHDSQVEQKGKELARGESAEETVKGLARVREFSDSVNSSPELADKLRRELERPDDT